MAFGQTPKDASGVPIAEVYVPGTANSDLTALEGIAVNTDSNSQKSAAVRLGMLDGDNVTQGAKGNAAATDSTSAWSVISLLKGILGKLLGSIAVTGTFWQATQPVSGSVSVSNLPGTQPVSGTVTANAGTNLNTSALALEAGHLATIDSHTPALGQALAASSVPVVLTAIQQTALTPPAAITGFALEAGHLATIDSHTPALGQATKANSVPVTIASDQPNNAWTQVYSTTQTGVSSWAGSGDITNLHLYNQVLININVSAITGTSIAFKIARKDSFGNYVVLVTGAAITAAGQQPLDVGIGSSLARSFGDILQITVALVAITSVTFTVDVEAR